MATLQGIPPLPRPGRQYDQRYMSDLVRALEASHRQLDNNREYVLSRLASPMAGLYISTPASTTIGSAGVYVKSAGTTTITNASAFMTADAVNNRLKYTRPNLPRHFHVAAQASIQIASGTNQDIGLKIYHYDASAASGAVLDHSDARAIVPDTNIKQIAVFADVTMDENDYVELWVANHTATINCTLQYGYLFAAGFEMAY